MDYEATWNLRSIPDGLLFSESSRRLALRRVNAGGARPGAGRPVTMVACPRCGQRVTATQALRGHGCGRKAG